MLNALDVLRSTIDDKWESAARVVELHEHADWGDGATEGSAMWHLWHTADCLRLHASKIIAADLPGGLPWPRRLEWDPALTPRALLAIMREDVERFVSWLPHQSDERLARTFDHGVTMNAQDMMNLMIRHVVWHVARAHGLLVDQA